jgi:hypothetical protein
VTRAAAQFPFVYTNENARELAPYLELVPETPLLEAVGQSGATEIPRRADRDHRLSSSA